LPIDEASALQIGHVLLVWKKRKEKMLAQT